MGSTGILLAIDGIDGSGKSTLASGLTQRLTERGIEAVTVRPLAPQGTLVSSLKAVRGQVAGRALTAAKLDAFLCEYFTYTLAANTFEQIVPRLATNTVVIADRYVLSHLVNQLAFDQDVWQYSEALLDALPSPHATLYVEAPINVALQRLNARRQKGAGDNPQFLAKADRLFREHASRLSTTHRLDGERAAQDVLKCAEDIVTRELRRRAGLW